MPLPQPVSVQGAPVIDQQRDDQRREARELAYWAALLHVTPEELRSAVQETGASSSEASQPAGARR